MSRFASALPVAAALLLMSMTPVASQETGSGVSFALGLGIGVESFGEETYQKLSLNPDIAFGKFGIGFELTLHFRFENSEFTVRQDDWVPDPSTFQETLSLYLSKFRYIRYGVKGDPFFAKFGSIDDATLGNGFIMGGYANTLFLPERRVFGLSLDVDGTLVDFPYVGLETFVGDLSAFDVMGARLFVRPLIGTEIPVLRNLQFGGTVAVDLDPYRYSDQVVEDAAALAGIDTGDARMYVVGLDVRQPILANPAFTLAAFGDVVSERMESYGGMVGVGGRLISIFTYGAQLRILGDNFVPVYFDSTYDISRAERYALIEGAYSTPGYWGWLASLGTSLLGDKLIFRVTLDGPFGEVDDNRDNYLNYPHLQGYLDVGEGILPGFFFDASYDKLLIRELWDLTKSDGAVAKARLNYRSGPAVISFFYLLKYNTNDWTEPEVSSGLETLIQLN